MLRTRVGYCGGSKLKPTYYALGDHTEAFCLDYDPSILTYEDLLGHFWNGHRCDKNNTSRQYINAIFFRDEAQKQLAEASRDAQLKLNGSVATEIIPMGEFTYAEGYHHKYYLSRYEEIRNFLEATYPDAKSLADSTVAMRLNAYLGSGVERDWNQFLAELPQYGLPDALQASLRETGQKMA